MKSISRSLSKLGRSKGSSNSVAKLSSRELQGVLRKIEHNEPEVTVLNVSTMRVSNKDFNYILDAVEQNQVLQEIDVSANGLEDLAVAELLNRVDISGNRKLRRINLSANCMGRASGKAIEAFLGKHLHVVELDISGQNVTSISQLGISGTKEFEIKSISSGQKRRIANLLKSNATVTNFALKKTSRLECVSRGIVVAEGFLPGHWAERMTALDMSNNAILHVPAAMAKFTLLQELQLSHNQLSVLPQWIGDLKALKVLDMSHNNLSDLPEAISKLRCLQTLNVSQNYITLLPLALADLPSLFILSAEGNPIENVPEEIVSASLYGDQGILRYIRAERKASACAGGKEEVAEADATAESFMETQLSSGGPDEEDIQLRNNRKTKKRLLEEAKDRSSISVVFMEVAMPLALPSSGAVSCSCKAGDAVWIGTSTGKLHVFDSRTLRLRETHDVFETAAQALCFVGLPHLQVWAGDAMGRVAIYDTRAKKLRVEQISPHSGIRALGYCVKAQEMWVASEGCTVYPVKVAAPVVEQSIDLDGREISSLLVVGQEVWVGSRDGTITILSQQAHAILAIFRAHSQAVTSFVYTGKYIFSAAQEKLVKVWVKKNKTWDCMMVLEVATDCEPQIAFGNGIVYTTGGHGGSIMVWDSENQFSLTSQLKTTRGETISSLVWTPSPDRLWSTTREGTALCHELKRGKKTIERLKDQGKGQSSGLVHSTPSREQSPIPQASEPLAHAVGEGGEDAKSTGEGDGTQAKEEAAPASAEERSPAADVESNGNCEAGAGAAPKETVAEGGGESAVVAQVFESYPSASALDLPETPVPNSLDPLTLLESLDADIADIADELDTA